MTGRGMCEKCAEVLPTTRYELPYARRMGSTTGHTTEGIYHVKTTTTSYEVLGTLTVFLCETCRGKILRRRNLVWGLVPGGIVVTLLLLILTYDVWALPGTGPGTSLGLSAGMILLMVVSIAVVREHVEAEWVDIVLVLFMLIALFGGVFPLMDEGPIGPPSIVGQIFLSVFVSFYVYSLSRARHLSNAQPTLFENQIRSWRKKELASIEKSVGSRIETFNSKEFSALR